METPDNKQPVAGPLRVGLIAEAEEVGAYLEALRATSALELVAQGGMPQPAALPAVPWFDDTRVLVAQGGVQALIIAGAPRVGVNVGAIALERGVHVWRPPPLGRSFAEAVEVARQVQAAGAVYRVASWWDFAGGDVRWALEFEEGCTPVFSELRVSVAGPALQSWRSSQTLAGGGVLLQDAYPALEALLAIRGLPESATAFLGRCRRPGTGAPRETEDIACVILRYGGGGAALVRAAWDLPPQEYTTFHHGKQSDVRYDRQSVAVLAPDGQVRAERALPAGFLAAELARFADQIRGPQPPPSPEKNIERHLAVSAVLEAAYLSARTEQPEAPRRLFEVQKWPAPAC